MIDFRWMKHIILSEPIDINWCDVCKLHHLAGDHIIMPIEPEIKEIKLLTNGQGGE